MSKSGRTRMPVTVTLSTDAIEMLASYAKSRGLSKSGAVEFLVRLKMDPRVQGKRR